MAVINLRVTDEQKAQLTAEATKHGLKLGTWVKARLFGQDFSVTQIPEPDLVPPFNPAKPPRLKRLVDQSEPAPTVETGPRPRPVVGASPDQKAWPTFGSSRAAPKPSKKK